MKTLITLALFLTAFTAQAQQVDKWAITGNWPKGLELVISQDAKNVLLSITNTTLKRTIPKNLFTSMTVVLDCKQSADYISLAQNFASVVIERDNARIELAQLKTEHEDVKYQYQRLIDQVKVIQLEMSRDTLITAKFPKAMFKKQP